MQKLTFVTGNMHKVKALEHWLGQKLDHHALDIDELQILDPHEAIRHKAEAAFDVLKTPVLVDDTSLTFHAWGHLPGTFIKWFLQELGTEGLCKALSNFTDRSATARVLYAVYDGANLHMFEGVVEGSIPMEPSGKNGFGWDSIFVPDGFTKTYAEMDRDDPSKELSRASARNQAVQKLKAFLQKDK